MLGDSLFAVNRTINQSVGDQLERQLGEQVIDRSVLGAPFLSDDGKTGIQGQYFAGNWDWVVINGFGNDVLFGCGCGSCDSVLNRLISRDGTQGQIPDFVARVRASGARVIYSGYLRTPGFRAPIESCGPIGFDMDRRLAAMAARDPGVVYLSMANVVPSGDSSYHAFDVIHPSAKGSGAIATRIAAVIKAN